MRRPDAVVVGSGPNGLAAALTLARAGLAVDVYEGADTAGGGCRTEELTIPGFRHDVCSAVHPLLRASPFFDGVDLDAHGVRTLAAPIAFCHPLDGARAGAVSGSVGETAGRLGRDAAAYRATFERFVASADRFVPALLAPMRSVPAHPLAAARFGLTALLPARTLAGRFETDEARAIVAGAASHAMLPLDHSLTGAFGLLFTVLAHTTGWPFVEGGTARVVDALADEIEALGGHVMTGRWVLSLDDLPTVRSTLLDVPPSRLATIAGDRLPRAYRRALARFEHGPGVFKIDWALSGPVPWASEDCTRAGTVHVGGTFEEVAASEADVSAGRHPGKPFCIVAQPGVVDPTRAPPPNVPLWGYCHVPRGSTVDMTQRVEAQIERFAPGFADLILARSVRTAADVEAHNPNCVGGDVSGGLPTLKQTIFRPVPRWATYATPLEGLYICSASTPPGGGVHGMCGFNAANLALARLGISR